MKVAYKKNDVYLVEYGAKIDAHRIIEVNGEYILWTYGWINGTEFHSRVRQRLGRARMFLGFQFGIIRD